MPTTPRPPAPTDDVVALRRQFFAARSIIAAPFRPLKLTEQALLSFGKRTGNNLAALPSSNVTLPASPGRYLAETAAIADRDLTLPRSVGVALDAARGATTPRRAP